MPSSPSLRVFPTMLSRATAIFTNILCTFRHLPCGALILLSRTSFFFALPQRQTYSPRPAKITPRRRTLDDPFIKVQDGNIYITCVTSAPPPHPLFSVAFQGTFSPKPRTETRRHRKTHSEKERFGCIFKDGVFSPQYLGVRLGL